MNYPKKLLAPLLKYLKKEEIDLKKRKDELEKEDPFQDEARLNDNSSDDVEAVEKFEHQTSEALSKETERALERVQAATKRVKNGTYGACVNCGNMINTDRLGVDPTAEHCIACAKLKSDKK